VGWPGRKLGRDLQRCARAAGSICVLVPCHTIRSALCSAGKNGNHHRVLECEEAVGARHCERGLFGRSKQSAWVKAYTINHNFIRFDPMRFAFAIILSLLFFGCKKYPEDKAWLHLRTSKARLCHGFPSGSPKVWEYVLCENKKSGIFYPIAYPTINFGRNNSCTAYLSALVIEYYNWDLDGDKLIFSTNQGNSASFEIKRLDIHGLIFENDTLRYEFRYPKS
jgi:hypothetical protein